MKIETKKLKNGFELPLLGFGTWGMKIWEHLAGKWKILI